jgi:hypothetical protein
MMVDFYAARNHTAAKPHRCECCNRTIPKGAVYTKAAGVWEGSFWSSSAHADCHLSYWAIREAMGADEMSSGYIEELMGGGRHDARNILDLVRGKFPHVVCRIEFTLRNWLDDEQEDDE